MARGHLSSPGGSGDGCLPTVEPGQRYAYGVHGPGDPASGHRRNPAKLLLYPYGKAIDGQVQWSKLSSPTASMMAPKLEATAPSRTIEEDGMDSVVALTGIRDYERYIGTEGVDRILKKAQALADYRLAHVNSTYYGGGVAEIRYSERDGLEAARKRIEADLLSEAESEATRQ
jgi:hypothetical protein